LQNFLSSASGEIIILVSSFDFGLEEHNGKLPFARKLFLNFLQGNFPSLDSRGAENDSSKNSLSKIKKLFILGNLVFQPEDSDLVEKGSYLKQNLNSRVYKKILQSYDEADFFLSNVSLAIETYLLPGENDISSSYFPQPKLCEFLFLHSKKTIEKTLHLKSNPFSMQMEDFSYLMSSGQNVDNIRKFSKINENEGFEKNSSIKIMEKTLDWGHLCPSAPDTLRTWPVKKEDPLMLCSIPNVYVVGNQKYFEASYYKYKGDEDKMVRLISVPKFSETFSFVLFDAGSLNVIEYCFEFFN
jgi:DNA polymerase delta subunit 2